MLGKTEKDPRSPANEASVSINSARKPKQHVYSNEEQSTSFQIIVSLYLDPLYQLGDDRDHVVGIARCECIGFDSPDA